MLSRGQLKHTIDDWRGYFLNVRTKMVPRLGEVSFPKKHALGLIGVRRSGKSWLAIDLARQRSNKTLYVNFEDPIFYIDSDVANLDELLSVYTEFEGTAPEIVVFDEIQNIPGWERWVRKAVDQARFQLIITGSSAKLLGSKLSTSLTGRCLEERIWPLSYREFLKFKGANPKDGSEHRATIREYFQWGGFPEVVLEPEKSEKKRLLIQYGQDLVTKDILTRFEVRNKRAVDQLVVYFATHASALHSYQSLRKAFQISVEMAKDYTRYLADAFYLFEVIRFHPKMKVQFRDARKVYLIDPGLRNVYSTSTEEDFGRVCENVVFLEFRRRKLEVNYFFKEKECDFIVTNLGKPQSAIQVCYSDLHDTTLLEREVEGLLEAMTKLHLMDGMIINLSRNETLSVKGKKVRLIPLHEWLMETY